MARTPSTMVPLGTPATPFTLLDTVTGMKCTLNDIASKRCTVLMFICNHCPFVKHIQAQLVQLANDYQEKGVSFAAISSNDVAAYPDDSPEKMAEEAERAGYPFPYLYDETQEVARAYQAACTPDFFVYDQNLRLIYRGQLDDSRPKTDIPVTGADLRNALDLFLDGKPMPVDQKPSLGCNIKWKS